MKENIKFKDFYVKPKLPEKLEPLLELSQNLWSTWDSDAYRLFQRIDPGLFRQAVHNPVKLLQIISDKKLVELAEDKGFLYEMRSVYQHFRNYLSHDSRISAASTENEHKRYKIAYLSMEYGLHESIPIYSGGLGILSGDHLKAASDLDFPLAAFGLLYRFGYFSQQIDLNGIQNEVYKENEWYSKAVQKVPDEKGNDLIYSIDLNGEKIFLKVWKIMVGKIPLFLLDSNLAANVPKFRKITDHLYISDKELRLLQEIVLAFGSIELMNLIDLQPSVFHMNEGHSAFLIIKRLQKLINEQKFSFEEARDIIYKTSVFTTHTPVSAGNEKFEIHLIKQYLGETIKSIGKDFSDFVKLGIGQYDNYFSLSAFAIRFSRYINGVSGLHCKVSKEMWHSIYPDLYEDEVPIKAITNGVHLQSWLGRGLIRLFDRYLGEDYRHRADLSSIWKNVFSIPDIEIWEAHQARKEQMISFLRNKLQNSLLRKSKSMDESSKIGNTLNNNNLIVGFARRFATYKRANLVLQDKERLLKILNSKHRPVQFVFSGKAHPADDKGKLMIKEIIDFARENQIEDKFVFIEDYDINIARHLIQGVDVWLNNPIKPLEASGTSGMKAGMNGVINLSVLDGWWAECFRNENGWAITSGEEIEDIELRNQLEANEIYELLEKEITSLFYNRNKNGLPENWVKKMKHSIYDVGRQFNMHRALHEYYQLFYERAINEYEKIFQNDLENLKELQKNRKEIALYWEKLKFRDFSIDPIDREMFGTGDIVRVKAEIDIDSANENLFKVELFYRFGNGNYEIIPLQFKKKEENIVHFENEFQIIGSGKQSLNVRIRPNACFGEEFPEFVKWYF